MHDFTRGFWEQHKFFLGQALAQLTEDNRDFRFSPDGSSAAFWLQHVAESKLFLLEAFYGFEAGIPLTTVMGATDQGQAGTVAYIQDLNDKVNRIVEQVMSGFTQEQLAETIETFLGPMTRANTFGAMIYHTYYHMGQAQLAIKRGQNFVAREVRLAA